MNRLQRFRQIFSGNRQAAAIVTLYLLIGLAAFFIGFSSFFPDSILQQRVQHELSRSIPGEITIDKVSYRFPFSVKANNIQIEMNNQAIPEFNFETIYLSPNLTGLFGKPGICFTATTREGNINGSVARTGEFSIDISDYTFNEPIQGFTDLRLAGEITDAQIKSHLQPAPDKPSKVLLDAKGLSLSGLSSAGIGVDRLNLGSLSIEMDGKGNNLVISKGILADGDIQAEASGRIVTGQTPRSTRLILNLQIRPNANLDPSLASLMELIGSVTPNGSRKLNIGGTLARPRIK